MEGKNLLVTDVYSRIKEIEKLIIKNKSLKRFCEKWLREKGNNNYFYKYSSLNYRKDDRIFSFDPLCSMDCGRSFCAMNFVITDKKQN